MTKSLVVRIPLLLLFLLLTGSHNLQKYAIFCQVTKFLEKNTIAWKCLNSWLKLGISWQIKEGKYNDKSSIHLPRQHLPQSHGRVCHEGLTRQSGPHPSIHHRLRRHQHRGNLERRGQPGLSPCPEKAGGARYWLRGQAGGAADQGGLPAIRLPDRNGQGQHPQYDPYVRRRP